MGRKKHKGPPATTPAQTPAAPAAEASTATAVAEAPAASDKPSKGKKLDMAAARQKRGEQRKQESEKRKAAEKAQIKADRDARRAKREQEKKERAARKADRTANSAVHKLQVLLAQNPDIDRAGLEKLAQEAKLEVSDSTIRTVHYHGSAMLRAVKEAAKS